MKRGDSLYIWQQAAWPQWTFDLNVLSEPMALATRAQGVLYGRLADVGFDVRNLASLGALTSEVMQSSAIEGEHLDVASVRSSVARRMGVDIGALTPTDRHVEGVVELVMDATVNATSPLTAERLFGWHAALFPTGYSGMSRIEVGQWRSDRMGPMQVVSGPIGRQRVHFEAPPAERLPAEVGRFLDWLNTDTGEPALIKAGIGHLWFVTLHPFDDGNGRIARAVGDMLLARAEKTPHRFYSLSAQIQRERSAYYAMLECTQKGSVDITAWLAWFIDTLHRAVAAAHVSLDSVLGKARFWQSLAGVPLNSRQVKVINRLLDGFDGKLTSRKWAAIAKTSDDTALRDINELVALGALVRSSNGGRSTHYVLNVPPPNASAPAAVPRAADGA